ncbi:MAG: acetyl-CoA C-acyltransferase, partial [Pseudomonas mandelii]
MNTPDVFVVSAARTAIGSFGGSLKDVPLADLATTAVKAALERSGV